jgi:hypothetical protein
MPVKKRPPVLNMLKWARFSTTKKRRGTKILDGIVSRKVAKTQSEDERKI